MLIHQLLVDEWKCLERETLYSFILQLRDFLSYAHSSLPALPSKLPLDFQLCVGDDLEYFGDRSIDRLRKHDLHLGLELLGEFCSVAHN